VPQSGRDEQVLSRCSLAVGIARKIQKDSGKDDAMMLARSHRFLLPHSGRTANWKLSHGSPADHKSASGKWTNSEQIMSSQ
jgi:hypothetical protein